MAAINGDTVVGLYCQRVSATPDDVAMHVRRGVDFVRLTWAEVADDVERTTAAIIGLGVKPGDRVILVSPNRYEWLIVDLAIQLAQAVHVPVHASLSGPQILYQIKHSDARVVVLSGQEQVDKLTPLMRELPADLQVVTFDACPESWEHVTFQRWAELVARADRAAGERAKAAALETVKPDTLATILYTSGTTGEPKGVMLSQRNLASNAVAALVAFDVRPGDLRLTWLPLSHIFARTCDLYCWIAAGCELALADAPEKVIENCRQLRPTLLNGVPYFFEKVMRTMTECGIADQSGKLMELFGGRLRACISGGAPLPDHVAEFYIARGIALVQGYGLTETSPVITVGTPKRMKVGTVGYALSGVEVRIADDGEILTRGPHVMQGYWKNPQATSETIRDGWLHTGDIGTLDEEGFLKITGRKKELIVTAGGKNIAPVQLEALLTADPLIKQAVVIGDRRSFLTALLVPALEALQEELNRRQIPLRAGNDTLTDERVRQIYAERVKSRLADVSRYEQIGRFTLLDREFSVAQSELTPTLKLRRAAVAANFADAIEAMYACGEGRGIPPI